MLLYAFSSLLPLVSVGESGRTIHHNIGIKLFRVWEWTIFSELRSLFSNLVSLGIVLIEIRLSSQASIHQMLLEDPNRIAGRAPFLLLFASAIVRRIGHRVTPEAV